MACRQHIGTPKSKPTQYSCQPDGSRCNLYVESLVEFISSSERTRPATTRKPSTCSTSPSYPPKKDAGWSAVRRRRSSPSGTLNYVNRVSHLLVQVTFFWMFQHLVQLRSCFCQIPISAQAKLGRLRNTRISSQPNPCLRADWRPCIGRF